MKNVNDLRNEIRFIFKKSENLSIKEKISRLGEINDTIYYFLNYNMEAKFANKEKVSLNIDILKNFRKILRLRIKETTHTIKILEGKNENNK